MGVFNIFSNQNIDRLKSKGDFVRLSKLLKSNDNDLRVKAIEALTEIGRVSLETLLLKLEEPDIKLDIYETYHSNIAIIIANIFENDIEQLIFYAKHENKYLRHSAIEALKKYNNPRVLDVLNSSINDTYDLVRYSVINELGRIGNHSSIVPLIITNFHNDNTTATHAKKELLNLLERIKDPVSALDSIYFSVDGTNKKVQEYILNYIIDRKEKKSVNILLHGLDINNAKLKSKIIYSFGNIGAKEAADSLIGILIQNDKKHKIHRKDIISALGKLGDKRALEPLYDILYGKEVKLKPFAISAIHSLKGFKTAEPLIELFKGKDLNLRKIAFRILFDFKNKEVAEVFVNYLKTKLNQSKQNVSKEALEAANALITIGHVHGAEGIEYLINHFYSNNWDNDYVFNYCKFFGDYTDLLLKSSKYIKKTEIKGGDSRNYKINYEKLTMDAIKTLCEIKTQISSNILHKVTQLEDIKVLVSQTCFETNYGEISYEKERSLAASELEKRGFPAYNPEIYVNKDAWKLD